jgi:photosystem II stability/assembly factor-like uncharacterized protein
MMPRPGMPRAAQPLALVGLFLLAVPSWAVEPPTVDDAFLEALPARCIGPGNTSGRITDIAVVASRPSTMYVASASGGLWKTVNNGTTWLPVFDRQKTLVLGAVAVAPSNPNVVWVGTGEANPRNSVSPGDGVYKSTDGGRTWACMGLRATQHIGRIVIHPANPDIVCVAALGHVWGPNKERGLYRTADGGRTWQALKVINEDTGFIDVAMDPADPDILYAAAWQVRRDGFAGGNPAVQTGPGSGLFRTADGGRSWERLTAGLPDRPLGRCGFAIYARDPRIVYAVVQTDLTAVTVQGQGANLREVTVGEGDKAARRKLTPDDGGVFRSADRGRTWKQVNSLVPRPFYYGQVRVDPKDPNRLYVLGIMLHVSDDGGRTFRADNAAPGTHPDHHALWIDPRDSDHLVLGGDGGLNFSYDRGRTWEHLNNLPVSQLYAVAVDSRRPYRVYGGLQDNGTWSGPSATQDPAGITFADWVNLIGADGFQCQVDPGDPETFYGEAQYGRLFRLNLRTDEARNIQPRFKGRGARSRSNIKPEPAADAPAFRFNWESPLLLSPHNPRTIYFGGDHLFRSTDRGETWEIISPDLTRGRPGPIASTGNTITTIAESPLHPGLLFVGTDDGRLHLSRDGGQHWIDLSANFPGMPTERWISRVICSAFAEGTAYATIDRHRNDDRRPYLYRTVDFGTTWAPLAGNLPAAAFIYVIREDPRRRDLLYLGTECGLFLSLDGGSTGHQQQAGLPAVPVHDLAVQPRDQELVIGTHGRGIYVMDVAPLQEGTPRALAADAYLFEVKPVPAFPLRRTRSWAGTKMFLGSNPPNGAVVYYHVKAALAGVLTLTIADTHGLKVFRTTLKDEDRSGGLHRIVWDLKRPGKAKAVPPPRVAPGDYVVTLEAGSLTLRRPLRVEAE